MVYKKNKFSYSHFEYVYINYEAPLNDNTFLLNKCGFVETV